MSRYRKDRTLAKEALILFPIFFAIAALIAAIAYGVHYALTQPPSTVPDPVKPIPASAIIDKEYDGDILTVSFTRILPDGTPVTCLWGNRDGETSGSLFCFPPSAKTTGTNK